MFALPSTFSTIHFSKKLEVIVPLEMLEQELDDWVEVDSKVMHIHRYFIVKGDLSPITRKSKFLKLTKEIRELKEVGWDYKKTEKYKSIYNKITQNSPPVLHQQIIDTEEKVKGYFSRIFQLYDSIALNGLLHVSELDRGFKKSFPIYVGIGATGNFFKLPSGKHRLAIAKMLNIKNVPVVINMIHYDWIKHKAVEKGVSEYQAICIILDDCKK